MKFPANLVASYYKTTLVLFFILIGVLVAIQHDPPAQYKILIGVGLVLMLYRITFNIICFVISCCPTTLSGLSRYRHLTAVFYPVLYLFCLEHLISDENWAKFDRSDSPLESLVWVSMVTLITTVLIGSVAYLVEG